MQAIKIGWKPDVEATIRKDANLTWIVQGNVCLVPSNKGAVQLDEVDLASAETFIKEYNANN